MISIEKVEQTEKAKDTEEKDKDTPENYYVDGVKSATLVVQKVFKGNLKIRDEIVFGQGGGGDCVWTFDTDSVGDQFLFYLTRPEKFTDRSLLPSPEPHLWFAFGCGRSTSLENATDDLLYLDNIAKRRGKTRISGAIGGWLNPDMDVEEKNKVHPTEKNLRDEDSLNSLKQRVVSTEILERRPKVPAGLS